MWDYIEYLFIELKAFFAQLWADFLSSFAAIIEAIPVPDFLTNPAALVLPDSVLFFVQGFNLPAGIAIIVTAYGIRFLIRRTPLVG